MLLLLDEFMQRSQFTIIIVAAVLFIVGLPRTTTRYRILAAGLAVLCLGAALQWYSVYVVDSHYFRDNVHWPYLVFSVISVALAGFFVFELISLRLFSWITSREKRA